MSVMLSALDVARTHARRGEAVLVVMENATMAELAFADMAADLGAEPTRVARTHGHERIDFASGGTITVVSHRSKRSRGTRADVVLISPATLALAGAREALEAILAASPRREVWSMLDRVG